MSAAQATELKAGDLGVTLATWVFILHGKGCELDDAAVLDACKTLVGAPADADSNALGQQLVDAVLALVGSAEPGFDQVQAAVTGLVGEAHVATDLGEPAERAERARAARRYQFGRNLPWIARIIDRFPDGTVGGHWIMVEELTDSVKVMDPYPWDDVDEQYDIPLVDFMVKWELAGCESLRYV